MGDGIYVRTKQVASMYDVTEQTVRVWSIRGVKNRSTGENIRLPRTQIGGRYVIKKADVEQFFERLK